MISVVERQRAFIEHHSANRHSYRDRQCILGRSKFLEQGRGDQAEVADGGLQGTRVSERQWESVSWRDIVTMT